jgi:hypothetical protein
MSAGLVNNNENTSARVDADAAGRGEGGTELIEMVEENEHGRG